MRGRRIAAKRIAVSRAPGGERVVTPLELFFDLVYVFAVGQLSHHLLEHVDFRTGAETLIMTLCGRLRLVHDRLGGQLARLKEQVTGDEQPPTPGERVGDRDRHEQAREHQPDEQGAHWQPVRFAIQRQWVPAQSSDSKEEQACCNPGARRPERTKSRSAARACCSSMRERHGRFARCVARHRGRRRYRGVHREGRVDLSWRTVLCQVNSSEVHHGSTGLSSPVVVSHLQSRRTGGASDLR
jgi:Bacterial low temperature requirement A protein (LtrA)